MSLLQRLRNLWGWSKIIPPTLGKEDDQQEFAFNPLKEKHSQAQIIKMKNPKEKFLKNNE